MLYFPLNLACTIICVAAICGLQSSRSGVWCEPGIDWLVWKQQHCCEVVGERRCEGVEGVWRYNDVCGGLLDSCG
ncbi:hypothetical protein EAH_00066720, partial [Eimeria acervulina]